MATDPLWDSAAMGLKLRKEINKYKIHCGLLLIFLFPWVLRKTCSLVPNSNFFAISNFDIRNAVMVFDATILSNTYIG